MDRIPQSASQGLRHISGGMNLPPGANSSLLLRNAWEDKFFSTLMMSDGASRAASIAGLTNGMGTGGMAAGNVPGLAALAAAQQMQNQQNKAGFAAFMQDRAQRGLSVGRSGAAAEAAAAAAANARSASFQRQTTAEILLEAAGELGTGSARKTAKGNRGKEV
jgi:hypothetical protein